MNYLYHLDSVGVFETFQHPRVSPLIESKGRKVDALRVRRKERSTNLQTTIILTNVIIQLIPGPIPADYNYTKRSAAPAQSGAAPAVFSAPASPSVIVSRAYY